MGSREEAGAVADEGWDSIACIEKRREERNKRELHMIVPSSAN
jgi:hypothetical protein